MHLYLYCTSNIFHSYLQVSCIYPICNCPLSISSILRLYFIHSVYHTPLQNLCIHFFPERKKYSNFTADVILLVDSSSGVNQNLFNREKGFVKSMVRSLDLSPGKSRVAVISFGSTPRVARFSSSGDVETVASEVDNIRYVSGRRNITKALDYAGTLLNQARTSVAKVIVLLTTGGELNLAAPSQSLKDHGTNRYVIAIAAPADEEDLIPIIDDPRDMFSIPTPHEFTWRTDNIIDDIIKRTSELCFLLFFKATVVALPFRCILSMQPSLVKKDDRRQVLK